MQPRGGERTDAQKAESAVNTLLYLFLLMSASCSAAQPQNKPSFSPFSHYSLVDLALVKTPLQLPWDALFQENCSTPRAGLQTVCSLVPTCNLVSYEERGPV